MLGLRPSAGGNEPPEKQPAPSGGSSAGPTAAAVAAATLLVQAVTELATAVAHAEVRTSIWGVDLCFTKEWAQRLAGPLLKLAGVGAAGVALVASGSLQAAINALPLVAALGPTPGAIIVGVLLVYAAVIAVQASRCPNGICIRVWWTDIVWPAFFVPPVVRCR